MRQLLPTSAVRRADRPIRPLPRAERTDLDAVAFVPLGPPSPDGLVTGFGAAGRGTMTWGESLLANYTDGILILHRGRIVYERYFGVLDAHTPHIAYSVTKSFVATVAAMLVHEGSLDEQATVSHYLPELASGGFADATIRHLLDMTTGVQYTEDYTDENSSVWQFTRAGHIRPRPPGYKGPESFYDYLRTLAKDTHHGERFAYKTVNTDTLGWVLRRVTGCSVSELLRERLWSKLGVEEDAYFAVDETGVEFAGGGLNLTLRDMARFGEMMRLGGRFNDQQIVPPEVVDDIRRGGNRDHFGMAGYHAAPRVELSQHVVGFAQRARRVHGSRNPRAGDLRRSCRRDRDRSLRIASAGRQRESRPDVAARLSRGRTALDARLIEPHVPGERTASCPNRRSACLDPDRRCRCKSTRQPKTARICRGRALAPLARSQQPCASGPASQPIPP